jgi:hypothetical protein
MNATVKVVCRDGELGILKEVVVNPKTLQPSYLIVLRTTNPYQTGRIHVRSIRGIGENEIMINRSLESMDFLTHHQLQIPITI